MFASQNTLLRDPLLTKTQHVIAGVAPELIPRLRALRPYPGRTANVAGGETLLSLELVDEILSALRVANQGKRAQAAPVILLEAAWSRVFETLVSDAAACGRDDRSSSQ